MVRDAGTILQDGTKRRSGILVIEDEALLASSIKDILEESGFSVAVASSGPEALSLAFADPPDLALIDIRLAGPMNGIEVAAKLRERLGVPSIFLSGATDPSILERAKLARPVGFLRKPFCPSQVFNAIERALGDGSTAR
ncbi:MAG TPA: response regulator [Stellaceae bacterium]|nr:response regulator [Stellaceae bacterium]